MSHPLPRPQLASGVASLLQAATASNQQATATPPPAIDRPSPATPGL